MSRITSRLRLLGRTAGGVAFAVACLATAVAGRTVNGLGFDTVSPAVAASLSLPFASAALLAYAERRTLARLVRALRPGGEKLGAPLRDLVQRIRGLGWRMWKAIGLMAFGVAAMLFAMLLALQRLESMGTVTAILFLGPLTLFVAGLWKLSEDDRLQGLFWMAVAIAGILCLTRVWEGHFEWLGVLFSVCSGVAYAAFFVAFKEMQKADKGSLELGVALANLLAAAVTVAVTAIVLRLLDGRWLEGFSNPREDWLTWRVVGIAALAGLLSGVLTQVGQALIFRKELVTLPTMSILTGLEPAMGVLLGWAILGQVPSALDWFGIVLVCLAGFVCAYLLESRTPTRGADTTTGDGR